MKQGAFVLASNMPVGVPDGVRAPRLDIEVLASALSATVSYPPGGGGIIKRVEDKTASDVRQAWQAARVWRNVRVYVSLSEKVGTPLALLSGRHRKIPHVLIAHHLTSQRKRELQKRTGYLNRFTRIVVLCQAQENYLREMGLSPEQVCRVEYGLDHCFWKPQPGVSSSPTGPVLSVGRERRDYETLALAARLLPDVSFVVVASSPWARTQATGENGDVPPNLIFRRELSWWELRDLYAGASAVVVPLERGTAYAAGLTGILEAMSMAKPLVVTQTPGITDYVQNETARVVPAGQPEALAHALRELRDCPKLGVPLGMNARQAVESGCNLDAYIAALVQIVRKVEEK